MIRTIKRLYTASIWGRESVSAEDDRVAGMLRISLPLYDITGVGFGITGYLGGIPALRDAFSDIYAQLWALTLAITCLVCLVGVAFPSHLWRVERTGKGFLVGLLFVYTAALFWAGITTGDTGRGAVGWAVLMLAYLPAWRVFDIARDRQVHGWR